MSKGKIMDEQAAPDSVREAERAVIEYALIARETNWNEESTDEFNRLMENLAALRAPKTCDRPAGSNWRWHWLTRVETGLQFPFEWCDGRWVEYATNISPEAMASRGYVYHSECRPSEPKVEPTDEAIGEFLRDQELPPDKYWSGMIRAALAHFSPIAKPAVELTEAELREMAIEAFRSVETRWSNDYYIMSDTRLMVLTRAIIKRVTA